ncbi:MerR family transcriptional regulator [Streptomyces sp. NPDC006173]|uniref:MerR family transcriptional regulator n=1 Tax=Streptomyces sp. NPDC006173 TaxID=3155349 RepID=UPI0034066053
MTADDSFRRLDDDDYPAYTMGRAAEMLGTPQGFLRAIGEARLITPLRSAGGHRRYSRYQLRIAARARELVDRGMPSPALGDRRPQGRLAEIAAIGAPPPSWPRPR